MSDTDSLEILLTNDDGIDSPGLRALYDALTSIAEVTVVAPASDQSAVGRSISHEVDVYEHDLGFAVEGTPSDCVVAGLAELGPFPDLVVSGCNEGANLGEYVLGRSGTISAAVEAAFFDVPAIASSLYVPAGDLAFRDVATGPDDYAAAARATAYLASHALEAGVFEEAAYLNVNTPLIDGGGVSGSGSECESGSGSEPDSGTSSEPRGRAGEGAEPEVGHDANPETQTGDALPLEITRPSKRYEMDASSEGGRVVLHDRVWDEMNAETLPDPPGTDRRAVVEGRISVSPLTAPHSTRHHDALDELVDRYPDPAPDV